MEGGGARFDNLMQHAGAARPLALGLAPGAIPPPPAGGLGAVAGAARNLGMAGGAALGAYLSLVGVGPQLGAALGAIAVDQLALFLGLAFGLPAIPANQIGWRLGIYLPTFAMLSHSAIRNGTH